MKRLYKMIGWMIILVPTTIFGLIMATRLGLSIGFPPNSYLFAAQILGIVVLILFVWLLLYEWSR